MNARTLLTFEQFEEHPDYDRRHELLQGEHLITLPDTIRRSNIRHAIYCALRPYIETRKIGEAFITAGFLLRPDTFLRPAGSFVRAAHLDRTAPHGYFEGAPAIAIEIASDSNTAAQLDRKIEQYFAHGSEEVWVVYPETRKIRIHLPDGTSRTASDQVTSAVLPGFSAVISTILDA